jgi:hypothetical protein
MARRWAFVGPLRANREGRRWASPGGRRAARTIRKPMTIVLLPHRASSEARVAGASDLGSAPEVMAGALALPSSSKRWEL